EPTAWAIGNQRVAEQKKLPDGAAAGLHLAAWAIVVVWFGVSAYLGERGFFSAHARAIPLFVLGPVALYILAFVFSRRLRAWALPSAPKLPVPVLTPPGPGCAFLPASPVR